MIYVVDNVFRIEISLSVYLNTVFCSEQVFFGDKAVLKNKSIYIFEWMFFSSNEFIAIWGKFFVRFPNWVL